MKTFAPFEKTYLVCNLIWIDLIHVLIVLSLYHYAASSSAAPY